jgi:hypothetical protein
MCLDLPTQQRYLNALQQLTKHPLLGAYARSVQRDLATPGVAIEGYITPIATLPTSYLTYTETMWRLTADTISQHG